MNTVRVHAPHLHARLGQVDLQRELLARVYVRVVRLREHALELLQLRAREGRADAPLLALLVQTGRVREELVRDWKINESRDDVNSSSDKHMHSGNGAHLCFLNKKKEMP